MNSKITLLLMLLIPVCLWNCSREIVPEEFYTVEVIEGVRHVHNNKTQWGDEPKVALEFVQKIGELESDDENYMFYQPRDVALDTDQNIYVLDAGNYRIQKFDTNGKYLATFGRKGQGPSEFENPVSLELDNEGFMYIADREKNRVIVLNKEGKEIRRFEPEKMEIADFILSPSKEIINNNMTVARYSPFLIKNREDFKLLQVYDINGTFLREFIDAKKPENPSDWRTINMFYYTLDAEGYIYATFLSQNRIEKFTTDGKLLFRADRELGFDEKITRKKSTNVFGLESTEIKINNFSLGIAVDDKKRIWVKTLQSQPQEGDTERNIAIELYDSEGVLLCKIPWGELPEGSLEGIYNDRLFILNDYEELAVYEYKIIEK